MFEQVKTILTQKYKAELEHFDELKVKVEEMEEEMEEGEDEMEGDEEEEMEEEEEEQLQPKTFLSRN